MKKQKERKNAYYDSVTLMIISKEVKKLDGVDEALVGMGTELNCELAASLGLNIEGFDAVTANDFFIAADCGSDEAFQAVVQKVDELLTSKADKGKKDYSHLHWMELSKSILLSIWQFCQYREDMRPILQESVLKRTST